jgi:hypothetical protein
MNMLFCRFYITGGARSGYDTAEKSGMKHHFSAKMTYPVLIPEYRNKGTAGNPEDITITEFNMQRVQLSSS